MVSVSSIRSYTNCFFLIDFSLFRVVTFAHPSCYLLSVSSFVSQSAYQSLCLLSFCLLLSSCFSTFSVSPSDYSFSLPCLPFCLSYRLLFALSVSSFVSNSTYQSLCISHSVCLPVFSFFLLVFLYVSLRPSLFMFWSLSVSVRLYFCPAVIFVVCSVSFELLSKPIKYIELFQERELESVRCIQHCQRGQARGRAVQNKYKRVDHTGTGTLVQ